jgi:hypothetical protein
MDGSNFEEEIDMILNSFPFGAGAFFKIFALPVFKIE